VPPFRFRLGRVLDWYGKTSRIEESRLHLCAEQVARARTELESHRQQVVDHQNELIGSPALHASHLAALDSFRRGAKKRDNALAARLTESERGLARQRSVTQAAQTRFRLVEKLRERSFSEYVLESNRELEQLASETHLASIARALNIRSMDSSQPRVPLPRSVGAIPER
jgi:hypothetical protein